MWMILKFRRFSEKERLSFWRESKENSKEQPCCLSACSWLQGRTLPSLLLISPRRRTASVSQLSPPPPRSRVTPHTRHPKGSRSQTFFLFFCISNMLFPPPRSRDLISVKILLLLLRTKWRNVFLHLKDEWSGPAPPTTIWLSQLVIPLSHFASWKLTFSLWK